MNRKKTYSCIVASFALLLSFQLLIAAKLCAQDRPNIVFIMTDDQSPFPIEAASTKEARPFGFCGDSYVHTPRIDSLAHNGMVFKNAYVSVSVCSASRYSILTGRYAGRCEAASFLDLHPDGTMIRAENNVELEEIADRNNLANLLQKAGYLTGFVGKSHVVDHYLLNKNNWEENGLKVYGQDADPELAEVNNAMSYNHNYWVDRIKQFGFDYVNGVYPANLKELNNDALNVHNLEWKNKAVLEFLDQTGDEPFFLYYSENIPHGPAPWNKSGGKYIRGLDANKNYSAEGYNEYDYSFMPDRQSIKDEIENMPGKDIDHTWLTWFDYAVGSVVDKLKEVEKLDNTIIVITSDHGHYRQGKATIYQGGVRVPLMFFWPEGIQAGSVYDGLFQNIDFAATFLDLAGVSSNEQADMDGKSFKSVLEGSNETIHEHLFFEIGYARGVATKDWKYIAVRYDEETEEKIKNGETFTGYGDEIIYAPYYTRNKHLGYYAAGDNPHYFERDQLYDLENDPWEETNLFEPNEDKSKEMKDILQSYLDLFPNHPFGDFQSNIADHIKSDQYGEIKVYPNPAKSRLYIKSIKKGCEYAVINMFGTRILEGKLVDNYIDINRLIPGIYLVELNSEAIRFIKK